MDLVVHPAATRLAGLELNHLLYANVLPAEEFEGSRVRSRGTPIYDLNGELLFYRIPITKGRDALGYVDLAAQPSLGAPLLRVSRGITWNERMILEEARTASKEHRGVSYDHLRFVAYSYPKVAVQFQKGGQEVLLLEWRTWARIPRLQKRKPEEPPSNFERWSFLDELPASKKRGNARKFAARLAQWERIFPLDRVRQPSRIYSLNRHAFERAIGSIQILQDQRELHYSTNLADHHTCYEVRGQLTNVWCVAASVQMLLDFYRYNYAQTRIASELGLGTLSNPDGLPYSRDGDVVMVLEDLSSNALAANMNSSPSWTEFRNEIRSNRPLISFIPGHSRTVVGYTRSGLVLFPFRGLLVYDPWPPTTGVITQWENFDAQTYRRTFKAQVSLA